MVSGAQHDTMQESLRQILIEGGLRLGVAIPDDIATSLLKYVILLRKWNSHINLVSADDDREVITRHIVDSLAVLPHLPVDTKHLVDVGSGAGLPGAVIAMFRPDIVVTALEPIHKKHAFINTLRREIPVPTLRPLAIRYEAFLGDSNLEVDVAVSRATFALPVWLELGAKVVRRGGLVLGMEGAESNLLPARASRHPYSSDNRTRAIIVYRPS